MPTTRNSRGREKTAVFNNENLQLERIIGSTSKSNVAFAVNPTKTEFATVSGCVTVISTLTEDGFMQEHFLQSGLNSITCVAYSPDGQYLAVGEKGKDPLVNIWDLTFEAPKLVKSIDQHRFGVTTLAFSASGEQLVTCGVQHDGMCHVWNVSSFGSSRPIEPKASVRVSAVLQSVAFYEEDIFVTVGKRHLKFWFLESNDEGKYSIEGRTAVLGTHRSSTFRQVEVRGALCLAITEDGHLCSVTKHSSSAGKPRFQISNFIDLKSGNCFSLHLTDKYAVCGCSNGTLAVFDQKTLEHVADMPRPSPLGATIDGGEDGASVKAVYPDVLATRMTSDSSHMAAFFSDGSFRLWNVIDVSEPETVHESTGHSQAVWDVQVHPNGDSFVTCSADNTIRFWNMAQVFNICENGSVSARTASQKEQIGVIHTDPTFKQLLGESVIESDESQSSIGGVRCVCFAPDMEHIASGDRAGNVRVHHMPTLEQVHYAAAHDSEVLSLSYCEAVNGVSGQLLATGSRDRLIHVFRESGACDGDRYELATTLDDHSSSITKVKFVTNEATGDVSLLSCSADKSLIFRSVSASDTAALGVERYCNSQAAGTIYDMDVDARTNSVVFSGKDKKLSAHSIVSGKANYPAQKTKKSTGDVLKLALDASGKFVATSSTDKGVRIYDLDAKAGKRSTSAECLAEAFATAEIMPALAIVPSSSHLLTVSGGGCIFVWKIADAIAMKMQEAMGAATLQEALQAMKEGRSSLAAKSSDDEVEAPTSNAASVFEQFVADAGLPSWAQGISATQPAMAGALGVSAPASGSKWALDGAMPLFSGETIGAPGGHDFASIFGNGTSYDDRRLTIEPSQISESEATIEEAEEAAAESEVLPMEEEAPQEDDALEQAITEVDSEFVNFQAFSSFGSMSGMGGMAKPRLSLSAAYRSEKKSEYVAEVPEKVVETTMELVEEHIMTDPVDDVIEDSTNEENVEAKEIVEEIETTVVNTEIAVVDEELVEETVVANVEDEAIENATAAAEETQEEESKAAAVLDSTETKLKTLDAILDQQHNALEIISDMWEGQTFTEDTFKPRAIADEDLQLLDEVECDESAEFLQKEQEERANFAYEAERTRRLLQERGIDYTAPSEMQKRSPVKKEQTFRRTPLKRLRTLNSLATPRSATRRDHQHVLANLRNAFNNAVRYYATLNTAIAEDMYLPEGDSNAILEDYELLFAEIDRKLPIKAADGEMVEDEADDSILFDDNKPSKPLQIEQFPDMLVQLAEMLRSQRL